MVDVGLLVSDNPYWSRSTVILNRCSLSRPWYPKPLVIFIQAINIYIHTAKVKSRSYICFPFLVGRCWLFVGFVPGTTRMWRDVRQGYHIGGSLPHKHDETAPSLSCGVERAAIQSNYENFKIRNKIVAH